MNENNIEILSYRPEFKQGIIELQKYLWGEDLLKNQRYFEWKHENNPYSAEPMVYVCLSAGRVVGTTAFIGAKWQFGDPPQLVDVPLACDSVFHPDFRNKGLFRKLNQLSIDDISRKGYQYSFAFSAAPITHYSFLLMGWRNLGKIRQARWHTPPVSENAVTENAVRRLARKLPVLRKSYRYIKQAFIRKDPIEKKRSNIFDNLDNRNLSIINQISPCIFVEKGPLPEEMATLVKQNNKDSRVRHIRDGDYFSWRYQNPFSDYRFLYWKDTILEGYLVLRASTIRSSSTIQIVDWEATRPEVQDDLFKAVVRLGNLKEIKIWAETYSKNTLEELSKYGFETLTDESNPSFLIKSINSNDDQFNGIAENRQITNLSNWDLRAIYSDYL
jgi:hypothetical protein